MNYLDQEGEEEGEDVDGIKKEEPNQELLEVEPELTLDKAIIKPAIIKISKSKNFKTNLQKSIIGDNSEKATNTKCLDSEKYYGCSYCDKTFTKPHFAKIHERVHTGEKPYACRYCAKKFSQSQSVTIHERIHTGDKPFACKSCNYKTTNSSSLKTHELTHVNGRLKKPNFKHGRFMAKPSLKIETAKRYLLELSWSM